MGNSTLELTFLGTGTSGCIPAISCITDPERGCECCLSTTRPGPEGKKNVRRNTSAILRVKPNGNKTEKKDVKTILVDCGKSFLTSALEWFPKKSFRKIDALIITHPHSDAMSGLDDLRGWTLGGAIQKTMDIYCTQSTFQEIERTYPYLVSAHLATGGGDVPAMNYIIFDETKTFDVCGVTVTPLPVHHGMYFSGGKAKQPYFCLGFLFNRTLAYISDVSFIPDSTWKLLEGQQAEEGQPQVEAKESSKPAEEVNRDAKEAAANWSANSLSEAVSTGLKLASPSPVLIIDCLRVYPHTSHFGIAQAVATARRLGSQRTYMMGYAHRVLHSTWESISLALEAGQRPRRPPKTQPGGLQKDAANHVFGAFSPTMKHSDVPEELREIALEVVEEWEGGPKGGIWTRPAYDGLTIFVDEATGKVWDDGYLLDAA